MKHQNLVIQLTYSSPDHEHPVWSLDGKSIFCCRYWRPGCDVARVSVSQGNEAVIAPKRHLRRFLSRPLHEDSLASHTREVEDGPIFISMLSLDRELRLTNGPEDTRPKWSPDGNWVAYLRRGPGGDELWALDVDCERTQMISGAWVRDFDWMPNGKSIVYVKSDEAAMGAVIVLDIASREERRLSRDDAVRDHIGCSPDGKWVACVMSCRDRVSRLCLLSAIDGYERILSPKDRGNVHWPKWSPDGKLIAYHETNEDQGCRLMSVSALSEQRNVVIEYGGEYGLFDWSQDGSQVAHCAEDESGVLQIFVSEIEA